MWLDFFSSVFVINVKLFNSMFVFLLTRFLSKKNSLISYKSNENWRKLNFQSSFFLCIELGSTSAAENVCYEYKCWKGTDTRVWTTFAGNSEYAKRMQCVTSSLPLVPPNRLELLYVCLHYAVYYVWNRGCQKNYRNHIFLLIKSEYSYEHTHTPLTHVRTLAVHTHQNTHRQTNTVRQQKCTIHKYYSCNRERIRMQHLYDTYTHEHFCFLLIVCVGSSLLLF